MALALFLADGGSNRTERQSNCAAPGTQAASARSTWGGVSPVWCCPTPALHGGFLSNADPVSPSEFGRPTGRFAQRPCRLALIAVAVPECP
jgi:hypothetical protein